MPFRILSVYNSTKGESCAFAVTAFCLPDMFREYAVVQYKQFDFADEDFIEIKKMG